MYIYIFNFKIFKHDFFKIYIKNFKNKNIGNVFKCTLKFFLFIHFFDLNILALWTSPNLREE